MSHSIEHSKQKFIFLLSVTAIYVALLAGLNFLQGPFWADEGAFWRTSLTFSDRLIPTIESISDYNELNTPLPFIVFGFLEYLFGQGIVAGRLLNIVLSIGIVFVIGWPRKRGHDGRMLCALGLLMCPYYLLFSGRLYTEMIACAFAILGFASYVRDRHLLSCIAFILAISSRQYMLAFPVAIATYEFGGLLIQILSPRNSEQFKSQGFQWQHQWRWVAPTVAALSILVWFFLFKGLAPEAATAIRKTPEVQKTALALLPGVSVNFLAIVGAYIVIPEFMLFQPVTKLKSIKTHWRRLVFTAFCCLLLFLIVPPEPSTRGPISQVTGLLPTEGLKLALLYGLTLLTCMRFYRPNLVTFIIVFNSLMMMKAYPWDKYVVPVAVVLWYLKSIGFEERVRALRRAVD